MPETESGAAAVGSSKSSRFGASATTGAAAAEEAPATLFDGAVASPPVPKASSIPNAFNTLRAGL